MIYDFYILYRNHYIFGVVVQNVNFPSDTVVFSLWKKAGWDIGISSIPIYSENTYYKEDCKTFCSDLAYIEY